MQSHVNRVFGPPEPLYTRALTNGLASRARRLRALDGNGASAKMKAGRRTGGVSAGLHGSARQKILPLRRKPSARIRPINRRTAAPGLCCSEPDGLQTTCFHRSRTGHTRGEHHGKHLFSGHNLPSPLRPPTCMGVFCATNPAGKARCPETAKTRFVGRVAEHVNGAPILSFSREKLLSL